LLLPGSLPLRQPKINASLTDIKEVTPEEHERRKAMAEAGKRGKIAAALKERTCR
jgi:hypothetical protein